MRFRSRILVIICLACLLAACGKKEEDGNLAAIVAISLTQTAAPTEVVPTPVTPQPTPTVPTGMISGEVLLMAPPTPHMTLYAVEINSGRWVSTETAPAGDPAPFTLVVPPGSYQVFGFTDNNGQVGYSADGGGLSIINVTANQTVADVIVKPPSQYECGSTYGVPAAPDNRFKAVPGPSPLCKATIQAARTAGANLLANAPQRVQFAPGAASTRIQETIPTAGRRYVLSAMAGQEMTVSLTTPGNPNPPPLYIVIQGADWSTLAPAERKFTQWTGRLPTTQDYYLDVASLVQVPVDCTLDIAIAALHSKPQSSGIYPRVIPPGFESLTGLSANLMLPAEFPTSSGLPEVAPFLLRAENGDIDVSLDYGLDCHGAGACHYGSLSVMKTYSADLQSTPNFTYDAGRVKPVSLAMDIPGDYIEGECGASCDDSRVFWLYNGHQYMIGLKGAAKLLVVEYANAAITNSLP